MQVEAQPAGFFEWFRKGFAQQAARPDAQVLFGGAIDSRSGGGKGYSVVGFPLAGFSGDGFRMVSGCFAGAVIGIVAIAGAIVGAGEYFDGVAQAAHGIEQGLDVVVAVGPPGDDMQAEVDFAMWEKDHDAVFVVSRGPETAGRENGGTGD